MNEWTAERIAALAIDKVKSLRDNAKRLGSNGVVELCDLDLTQRAESRRSRRLVSTPTKSKSAFVIGFHFVCPDEKGVTRNPEGTIWTGTWVVDAKHAQHGSKIDAYVALHSAKSEPSYLQGTIKDWRRATRESECAEGREVKIDSGIDFLFEPTDETYEWRGDGAGEKGYAWE